MTVQSALRRLTTIVVVAASFAAVATPAAASATETDPLMLSVSAGLQDAAVAYTVRNSDESAVDVRHVRVLAPAGTQFEDVVASDGLCEVDGSSAFCTVKLPPGGEVALSAATSGAKAGDVHDVCGSDAEGLYEQCKLVELTAPAPPQEEQPAVPTQPTQPTQPASPTMIVAKPTHAVDAGAIEQAAMNAAAGAQKPCECEDVQVGVKRNRYTRGKKAGKVRSVSFDTARRTRANRHRAGFTLRSLMQCTGGAGNCSGTVRIKPLTAGVAVSAATRKIECVGTCEKQTVVDTYVQLRGGATLTGRERTIKLQVTSLCGGRGKTTNLAFRFDDNGRVDLDRSALGEDIAR